MKIKVLGPGCGNCKRLEENVRNACKESGIDAEIEKVTDINEIINHGVMATPALVIDGEIILSGKVPCIEEIKKILKE